jgi:amidase
LVTVVTSYLLISVSANMSTWQELVAEKKRRQAASIPREWLITPPADDVLDVTDVPSNCGVLSARELEITAVSEVALLLNKLATGEWSSVEVTTAFCKRAIVAHQLVCPPPPLPARW